CDSDLKYGTSHLAPIKNHGYCLCYIPENHPANQLHFPSPKELSKDDYSVDKSCSLTSIGLGFYSPYYPSLRDSMEFPPKSTIPAYPPVEAFPKTVDNVLIE